MQDKDKEVARIVEMGFTAEQASYALRQTGGSVEEAINSLLRNGDGRHDGGRGRGERPDRGDRGDRSDRRQPDRDNRERPERGEREERRGLYQISSHCIIAVAEVKHKRPILLWL